MNAVKRKRNVLNVNQKLEILQKINNGESAKKLANDYKIGVQTVRDIKKNEEKIITFTRDCDDESALSKRKSMKSSTYKDLDSALLKWFTQKRAEGIPISGVMCSEKAKFFHESLGIEGDFNASSGWLTRFKRRHGIRQLNVVGERLSADMTAAESFSVNFQKYIDEENFTGDQIYNADETGLYWKCLPTKTLASQKEMSAPGHKSSKERITIMCCGNASGDHKMKLVMIGKAKKPRSFKGTERKNLPVVYFNQKGAWMTRDIFLQWFHEHFVPEVRKHLEGKALPQKAVLILDNAPSHPNESLLTSDDGLITCKFLPPNVTAAIQPMDQGVISAMKRIYRSELLKNLIHEAVTLQNFWKQYSLLDAVYGISAAWSKVKSSTLSRSWGKIMPLDEQCSSDNQKSSSEEYCDTLYQAKKIEGFENIDAENLEEWFESDACEPGFQYLTDEGILSSCVKSDSDDNIDDEEELNEENKISHSDALQSVENLLDYMGQTGFDYGAITAVRKVRVDIQQAMMQQKQTQITNFFKP